MPRVVTVADLHGNLPADLPDGDVLAIAGDVCPLEDHSVDFQRRWLEDSFYPWLGSLPHPDVVWIAGNHDFACQSEGWTAGGRGTYLLDSATTAAGLSFYGTPWVPKLRRWAFYAADEERAALFGGSRRSTSSSRTAHHSATATGSPTDGAPAVPSSRHGSKPSLRDSAPAATSTRTTA